MCDPTIVLYEGMPVSPERQTGALYVEDYVAACNAAGNFALDHSNLDNTPAVIRHAVVNELPEGTHELDVLAVAVMTAQVRVRELRRPEVRNKNELVERTEETLFEFKNCVRSILDLRRANARIKKEQQACQKAVARFQIEALIS
jgi:DNA-directed RNA polymerase alpha subunit